MDWFRCFVYGWLCYLLFEVNMYNQESDFLNKFKNYFILIVVCIVIYYLVKTIFF